MITLLLAETKKQNSAETLCSDLYKGDMFAKGLELARKHNMQVFVLAYNGFKSIDTTQTPHTVMLSGTYAGPFPPEPYYGFHLGPKKYFAKAPETFKPLVPSDKIGERMRNVRLLLEHPEYVTWMIENHDNYAAI